MTPEQLDTVVAWWASRWEKPESREAFAAALRSELDNREALTESGHLTSNGSVFLHVDYDPAGPLLAAARAVEPDCRGFMFSAKGLLPYKTRMSIYPDGIEVSCGYGAPWEPLTAAAQPQPQQPPGPPAAPAPEGSAAAEPAQSGHEQRRS